MLPDPLLDAAVRAVVDAARACRRVQAEMRLDAQTKGDQSPVTIADYAAQAIVSLRLAEVAPEIPLIGEEDAAALRAPESAGRRGQICRVVAAVTGVDDEGRILAAIDRGVHPGGPKGRHWTLDPIDGTKGFLRGDQYAVALALIEDGAVRLGVLGCPALPHGGATGAVFWASRGGGAFARPLDGDAAAAAIAVDPEGDVTRARFCESVEAAHSAHDWSAEVADALGVKAEPYRIDSQCKYAAVARGDAAIYLRLPTRAGYVEKIWDHAAGCIVVEEAGGRVSDITGKPLDFSLGRELGANRGVVATNRRLHDAVISAIAGVEARRRG
ncbi:MAG: 3'(2'),5'-bisphosphate nucleotidase [bacterium]|nr:3'(2'),5'-bisphosphate nucleotidase [Myxococcales bacterium]